MVKSVLGTSFTKGGILTQGELLCDRLQHIAEMRNTCVTTPHIPFMGNLSIGDVVTVCNHNAHSARFILKEVLKACNLSAFEGYIPYFSGELCQRATLLYMGSKFYWKDFYQRYTSLEAWANSLIGKEVHAPYCTGIVQKWDYCKKAKYSVMVHMYNDIAQKGIVTRYDMPLSVRNNVRNIERAKQEGTLLIDDIGMYKYPAIYWAESQVGHRILAKDVIKSEIVLGSDCRLTPQSFAVQVDYTGKLDIQFQVSNFSTYSYELNKHVYYENVVFSATPPKNTHFEYIPDNVAIVEWQ